MEPVDIIASRFPDPPDMKMEKILRVLMGKDRIFYYGDFVFTVSSEGIVHLYGGTSGQLEAVARRFLKDVFEKTSLPYIIGIAKRRACLYYIRKFNGKFLGMKNNCYMFMFYR